MLRVVISLRHEEPLVAGLVLEELGEGDLEGSMGLDVGVKDVLVVDLHAEVEVEGLDGSEGDGVVPRGVV